MVFCKNCGTQTPGAFCPNCGAPAEAPGAASVGPTPGASAAYGSIPPAAPSAAGITDNVAGTLCYAFGVISGIIFLVLAPYNQNKTIRFHAFQSIFLSLANLALFVVVFPIVTVLLHIIHLGLLTLLLFPVEVLLGFGFFALWLYMLLSTFQGKKVVLPVIGPLAEKQA
jgi:uncharacterized membrane protein